MNWTAQRVAVVLAIGVLAVLTLGAFGSSTASAACPPFEVIGARGSGQDKKKDEMNMGPEIHAFYGSLRSLLGGQVVKGYGLQYPAAGSKRARVAAFLHVGGSYTDSVREGADEVLQQIQIRRRSGCKSTKFILAGYSQGAQVMGDALRKEEVRSAVVAMALFGDPYFNADSWSARGSFDPSLYGIFGPRPEWHSNLYGHAFSYCHWHDPICNISSRRHIWGTNQDVYVRNTIFDDGPHETYITEGDTGQAARDVARALGFTPSPLPYTGPLDIAFAIDSTGSMADEIEEVKENVKTLVGQIAAINPDYRLALVDYKDTVAEESEYQARLDLDFTTDVAGFESKLSDLEASGGGDFAESVYSGVMTALGLAWRPGSKKIVVQIGDAPAKDPEPGTGYTLKTVQSKALSVDPAVVDTIQVGEDEEASSSFQGLASATSGLYLHLPESDLNGLVPGIVDQIHRNTAAPAAMLTTPSRVIAGQSITLSAGASRDLAEAIAGYDWDFDGNGIFDASTTQPVATTVYPGPFSGTAVLRVRSVSGLSSLATAPILVVAADTRRPRKPKHLRVSLRKRTAILKWHAGRGALPQWFTIFGARAKPMGRIAVSGARREFTAAIKGLNGKRRYRFSVAAGSEGGESKRIGPVVVKPRHDSLRRSGGRR